MIRKSLVVGFFFIIFSNLVLSIFVAPISEERYQVLKKKEMTQLRAGLDCCLSDTARLETEDYFNERIRFKQKYLGWYSYLHYRVGVSVAPEDVLVGNRGLLFLGDNNDSVITDSKGLAYNPTLYANHIRQFVNKRKQIANKYNVPYLFFIIPDKHSIYTEELPKNLKGNSITKQVTLKQMKLAIGKNPRMGVYDLTNDLREVKALSPDLGMYRKTDSHWSNFGSYIGYKGIMKVLRTRMGPIPILKYKNVKFLTRNSMDLAYKLNLNELVDEAVDRVVVDTKDGCMSKPYELGSGNKIYRKPNLTRAMNDDKVKFINECGKGRLLFIGDSFKTQTSVYFNHTFREVVYLHPRMIEAIYPEQYLNLERFDAIIYVGVERAMDNYIIDLK